MVALEALSCGLPVVTTSEVHSLPSSVLRLNRDVDSWVEAIRSYFEGELQLDSQQGLEQHQLPHVVNQWKICYESLLSTTR